MPKKNSDRSLLDYWFLGVFLIGLVGLTWMAVKWGRAEKLEPAVGVSPGAAVATGRVVDVYAGLSQSRVEVGKPVRFWLTIHNRTALPITNVSLEPAGLSGFQISTRCWRPAQGSKSCIPPEAPVRGASTSPASPDDLLVRSLAPCQTLSIWGEFSASEHQEKQTLFVTLRWVSHDQHPSQYAVPLGAIAADAASDKAKERWAFVVAFYKDLGIPLLLVLLAYLVKKWEEGREHRRQKAESDRQQLLQTWNQMLPVSHKDATKYNMPFNSALGGAVGHFKACLKAQDAGNPAPSMADGTVKNAFYYFLLSLRRYRSLYDDRGGFYFKDRTGERITAYCLDRMFALYVRQEAGLFEITSRAISTLQPHEKAGVFMPRLEACLANAATTPIENDLYCAYEGFLAWIPTDEFRQVVPLLDALNQVLDFEINKPYEFWYPQDQKERLKLDKDMRDAILTTAKLAERAQPQKFAKFAEEVNEYFKRSV